MSVVLAAASINAQNQNPIRLRTESQNIARESVLDKIAWDIGSDKMPRNAKKVRKDIPISEVAKVKLDRLHRGSFAIVNIKRVDNSRMAALEGRPLGSRDDSALITNAFGRLIEVFYYRNKKDYKNGRTSSISSYFVLGGKVYRTNMM